MEKVTTEMIRIWVYLHQNEIIKDIEKLVRIPSISVGDISANNMDAPFGENCRCVLETMKQIAQSYHMTARIEDNILCKVFYKEESIAPKLGLWAHLDVVNEGIGWHYPPFQITRKDSFLIGRGVQDNKSPALGLLYAMRCLKELEYELPYSCVACYGSSEENGMLDLDLWTRQHQAPEWNLVADCGFPVCYGEKGRLELTFAFSTEGMPHILNIYAGEDINSIPDTAWVSYLSNSGNFTIEAKGKSTHIIAAKQGENAIYNLCTKIGKGHLPWTRKELDFWKFLQLLSEDNYGYSAGIACEDRISGKLAGTVTWLRMAEGKILAAVDYRYPIQKQDGNWEDAAELIYKLTNLAESFGGSIHSTHNSKPVYQDKNSPFVRTLLDTYHHYTGSQTEPYVMSGSTYARRLPNAVGFGMSLENKKIYHYNNTAAGGDYHEPDESICIEDIFEGIIIYCLALMNLGDFFVGKPE